ncbi:MAG: SGNH/GDSL hydrolase family protein [Chitinophagales bacterium]|nr:SGNH/GDSL hydrolase family protein [Chitinophagales bacterium]MDW8419350.1 SGNH/GDSL hydrolase family protein [Chitinophagales bacterium]
MLVRFEYSTLLTFALLVIFLMLNLASAYILSVCYERRFDKTLIQERKYFETDGLKPLTCGTVWGKRFCTDRHGGRRPCATPGARKKKMLVLGDSVAQGVGVSDCETFSSIASDVLSAYEVINLSLIGYSTYDYVNVLRHFAATDTSVAAVHLFYCLNDVYAGSPAGQLPRMGNRNSLAVWSERLQRMMPLYKLLKLWYFRNADNYYRYDAAFYQPENTHFRLALRHLALCDSLCRAAGAKFHITLLPYRSQLNTSGIYAQSPQQLLSDSLRALQIPHRDLLYELNNVENPAALYLFADEIHFSSAGHRTLAGLWLRDVH